MNNKLIEEFMSMGCKTHRNASVCLQVYLDLCEVKRFWNVKYAYSEPCEAMYITCRRSKSAENCIYIPRYISDDLDFQTLQKFFSLCPQDSQIVNLAILAADSTLVYYQVENGIGAATREVLGTSREDKREVLDNELKKHKKLLEQSALYGVAITLPKKNAKTSQQNENVTKT